MISFSSDILLPFPNSNDLNSRVNFDVKRSIVSVDVEMNFSNQVYGLQKGSSLQKGGFQIRYNFSQKWNYSNTNRSRLRQELTLSHKKHNNVLYFKFSIPFFLTHCLNGGLKIFHTFFGGGEQGFLFWGIEGAPCGRLLIPPTGKSLPSRLPLPEVHPPNPLNPTFLLKMFFFQSSIMTSKMH